MVKHVQMESNLMKRWSAIREKDVMQLNEIKEELR